MLITAPCHFDRQYTDAESFMNLSVVSCQQLSALMCYALSSSKIEVDPFLPTCKYLTVLNIYLNRRTSRRAPDPATTRKPYVQ